MPENISSSSNGDASTKSVALGVDVGGTFTDCILIRDNGAAIELTKIPSRADRPDIAVLEGVSRLIAKAQIAPDIVDHFGHGTTVATNTVIEETGANVGVIVTAGFRDSLFLRRVRFPRPTNMNGPLPRQLVRRRAVIEVAERIDVAGKVITSIDVDQAVTAAQRLIEQEGVSAIAVCFLHAYKNPSHEDTVKAAIQAAFPGIFVTCSSEVSPRPREYERFMTTVMNAYVGERMRRYLLALGENASQIGLTARTLVTKSDGGILNTETAEAFPVQTMLSGPAAGVVAAYHCARSAGFVKVITWDMGGTSLDVAVLGGHIPYTEEATIGEHPLFIPTVDVVSIGAGGGSIGWIDPVGMMHVGPRSAGANPGPACYGRGATEPALTDAYVALGIVDPSRFANGELKLDREKSLDALKTLGERLGLDALATAEAMIEIATAQIQTKCMPLLARYGIDPEEYALLPYGGAGPTHAFLYAKAVGIRRVLVPPYPGLLCALGTVMADLRFEIPRHIEVKLNELDEEAFNAELEEMGRRALRRLEAQRVFVTGIETVRSAFMRYVGQSFELEVPLTSDRVTRDNAREAFFRTYHARYGYHDDAGAVEIISVVARTIGHTIKPNLFPASTGVAGQDPTYLRQLYLDGAWVEARAVARESLRAGDTFRGPIVIDQSDTTTFVPAGFTVCIDDNLNIIGELDDETV